MDQVHEEDSPQERASLAGSQEPLVARTVPMRSTNGRAFKVAGLTTLACLLLASQVFTAYMVFGQNQQIGSLKKDSEKMAKQLTRSSQAVNQVRVPMRAPMMMDLTLDTFDDGSTKPVKPAPEVPPIVSMEMQLMDFLQAEPKVPQFNGTFLANLESMKQQMNESDWKGFETWLTYWLLFQAVQQEPAPPAVLPALIQTKCQLEAVSTKRTLGKYKPQCDDQGRYLPVQCWYPIGYCWCVDAQGTAIEGTKVRGKRPVCPPANRQTMLASKLIQTLQDN